MKPTMILIASVIFAVNALAQTVIVANEKTAVEIVSILTSAQVRPLLSQESSYFKGIRYERSGRAKHGPARYELTFEPATESPFEKCTVPVDLNIETREVMQVFPAHCK